MGKIVKAKIIALIFAFALFEFLSGCASIIETGKKIWGSSALALEKRKDEGKSRSFQCKLTDCFNECEKIIIENNSTIFKKSERRGYILAMNFEGAVDTTEVGIFFEKESEEITKIKIISLNPRLLETVAPLIFSKLEKKFSAVVAIQDRKEQGR